MILESETFMEFGHRAAFLSTGSSKRVCLKCDYCECAYSSTLKNRNIAHSKLPKDACNDCKYVKREEVSLLRDGFKNSAQRPDVKSKIRATNENMLKSESFKEHCKKVMLERHGVENAASSPTIMAKQRKTLMERYGVDNIMKHKDVAKEASKKSVKTRIQRGYIKQVDGKTMPQHAKELGFSRSYFGKLVKSYGFEEAIRHDKRVSSLEKAFSEILTSTGLDFSAQVRIDNKVADFVCNDIAFECDGLYWHSDFFVNNNYHVDKMRVYRDNNLRSMFFRSDEIIYKTEIVRSIVRNCLRCNSRRMMARKLKVREISKQDGYAFILQNHLMGKPSSVSSCFGLFNGEELVSVLQMKKHKNNIYEISRFCSKLECSVVGGFSRLLSCFTKKYIPSEVFTFIDLRYGMGDYLEPLGFTKVSCYKSFKWTNGSLVFHRMKFPSSSGYDMGYAKIWDCGQAKYSKKFCV